MSFTHLIVHTESSIDKGIIKVEDMLHCSESLYACITDSATTNYMVGFADKCMLLNKKAIYGINLLLKSSSGSIQGSIYLLCKNLHGYKNLCALVSEGYKSDQRFNGLPTYNISQLKSYAGGLMCMTGGMYGPLGYIMLYESRESADQWIHLYKTIYGEKNLVIDIHRVGYDPFKEKMYERLAVDAAYRHSLPIVATNYCSFLRQEDYMFCRIKKHINNKETIYGDMLSTIMPNMYYKSHQEMQDTFQDMPNALYNTTYVAEQCNVSLYTGNTHIFPQYGKGSAQQKKDLLTDNAYKGLESMRIPVEKTNTYKTRLQHELDTINSKGFTDYFLIVQDLIKWAKDNNIAVGPGRGSAAGSLLARTLEITQVDPIEYDLLFARFLNLERVTYPDIDIDFCVLERELIFKYLQEKYNKENVSHIIAVMRWNLKSAIKDVSRVLTLNYQEINDISKAIPFECHSVYSLTEYNHTIRDKFKYGYYKLLAKYAEGLIGITKNYTRHAAGIVIAPFSLEERIGVHSHTSDDVCYACQWDMTDLEKAGMLKLDCLGLRTLTSIKCIEEKIDTVECMDLCDADTLSLIAQGDTVGVFQLETMGIRNLCRSVKVQSIKDIAIIISLYRPGPINSGIMAKYIKKSRDNNQDDDSSHVVVQQILEETQGFMIYQEQIMLIAEQISGFTKEEGDSLQKAISKKKEADVLRYRAKFIRGAVTVSHMTETHASKIFDDIQEFCRYGFNKSHAISYALISYKMAFYKTHYPAHFFAALLNTEQNPEKLQKYMFDAIQHTIAVSSPCINYSGWLCTYRDGGCVLGFSSIKGMSSNVIKDILEARKDGLFKDFYDFISRVFEANSAPVATVHSLIYAGALDILGYSRNYLINITADFFKRIKYDALLKKNPATRAKPVIIKACVEPWVDHRPLNKHELILAENNAIGCVLSTNVMEYYSFWLSMFLNQQLEYCVVVHNSIIRDHNTTLECRNAKGEVCIFTSKPDILSMRQCMPGLIYVIRTSRSLQHNSFYNAIHSFGIEAEPLDYAINKKILTCVVHVDISKLHILINMAYYWVDLYAKKRSRIPYSSVNINFYIGDRYLLSCSVQLSILELSVLLKGIGKVSYIMR